MSTRTGIIRLRTSIVATNKSGLSAFVSDAGNDSPRHALNLPRSDYRMSNPIIALTPPTGDLTRWPGDVASRASATFNWRLQSSATSVLYDWYEPM
eukprot:scaffold651838_cov36-Prasinocladus_malaysianus.AAC.1